ncbi:MAG: T9SS type A sorting domain-containing protein, partial [Bacteroidetes bacterium]
VQTGKKYSYYVTAFFSNGPESQPSNKVEVNVVAPVIAYGVVNGFVKADSTAAPLYKAYVSLIPKSGGSSTSNYSTKTDSNGYFKVKVKTGQYYMYFSASGYVSEYFDNVTSHSQATAITVNENDSLSYNIGLKKYVPPPPPVTYSVTGWVKDGQGNAQKSYLTAYVVSKRPNTCGYSYSTKTDSNGNFKFVVKGGDTLKIYVKPNNQTFKNEYWDNKFTFEEADRIAVNGNVTDINVTLDLKPVYNNGISGSVKDSAGTIGLKGSVYVYRKSTNGGLVWKSWSKTDTVTGGYTFTNLEPGKYILFAHSRNYKPTYFKYNGTPTLNWREADSVMVGDSGVVSGINFNLRSKVSSHGDAIVYGEVRDGSTSKGSVVDGAVTYLVDGNGEFVDYAVSEMDGSYLIEGLQSGSYTIVTNMINFNDVKTNNIMITGTNQVDVVLQPIGITEVRENGAEVENFELGQNYPNPFNPSTTISYTIPENSYVTMKIYNILGNEVATIINENQTAGSYKLKFTASNLSSGVYFYKIQAGSFSDMKKFVLLK